MTKQFDYKIGIILNMPLLGSLASSVMNCLDLDDGVDKSNLVDRIGYELLWAISHHKENLKKYYIIVHNNGYISIRMNGVFGEDCIETFHGSLRDEFNLCNQSDQEIIDTLFDELSKSKYLKISRADHLPILSVKIDKQ